MLEIQTTGPNAVRCMANVPALEGSRPLLVFLHGIGERGMNLQEVLSYGPLDQIRDGVDIGPAKDWIIIHPQNASGEWTIQEIDEVIEYAKTTYSVDEDRIYLMGVSHGGKGVWYYAQSPEHVAKLAAIVPICGGGNDPTSAYVLVNDGIPGWAAHSVDDKVVPYNVTKRMVAAVNQLAGRSQILFSEYGMYGHNAWVYFLRPTYGVYDWLFLQKKSNRRPKSTSREILVSNGEELLIRVK